MKKNLVFFLAVVAFLVFSSQAGAQGRSATAPGMVRATQAKMRTCEAREAAVKTRMTQLVRLSENMQTKFDAIAARVKTFYTEKVLPTGKTVSNYDSLVGEVDVKKTAVTDALTKAQADLNGFSCLSGDPRAHMNQFRLDMQAVKKALKEYRTSIKNLIVAVHSVVGEEEATVTPTETE